MVINMMTTVIPHLFFIEAFHTPYDYYWDEYFTFQGEKHTAWEIVYVLDGEVESTEDDRIYHLKAGDMLLHAPMEFHKIRSYGHTMPHLYVFAFDCSGNLPESLKNGVFSLSDAEQKEYKALFKTAKDIFYGKLTEPNACFLCSLQLSSFLCRVALDHENTEKLSSSRPAQEYHKLVLEMTRSVYENCTLQDFSLRCNISVSYIKDLFLRYAGISPKAYYSRLRCEEAIRLLESGMTVQEVSEKMHFSSPSYFSEFFSRLKGMPPARYIKSNPSIE